MTGSGRSGAIPASSSRIALSVSGSSRIETAPRRSVPQPGRRSRSSGRASVSTKIGLDRPQSRRCSRKSSRPSSDHCRSSTTNATVPVSASRSKKVRQAAKSSVRPPAGDSPIPSRTRIRGSIQARSVSSAMWASTIALIAERVASSSSPSVRFARRRIISPSAQKVTPSPYDGERPRCHQTCSTTPSRYFSSSQASRLLPIPAWPTSETSRARCSRPVAWNCSLRKRSSSVRPTNGGSSASGRRAPPRSPTTRIARQAGTGEDLPLSSWSPAATNSRAGSAAMRVASPTSTVPGGATDWSLAAVLTMSPVTIPCPSAPTFTAAAPVRTPTRTDSSTASSRPSAGTMSTRSRAARTARSASSSCAMGAPHRAITASPMNFSTAPP